MTTKKHLFTGQNTFLFPCTLLVMSSDVTLTGSGAKKKEEQNEAKLGEVSNVQSKMP